MTHKVCCNCFCGFCIFFGFCSFCSCCGFYGVWLLWLLVSSPFGVVLVRWLLRFLGFCVFPSEFICMCLRKGLTHVFNKCPNLPLPFSKFWKQYFRTLVENYCPTISTWMCFTTNNLWGKRGAQFFIWTYMGPIGKPKQMNGISEEIQFHIAFIWVYLSY